MRRTAAYDCVIVRSKGIERALFTLVAQNTPLFIFVNIPNLSLCIR